MARASFTLRKTTSDYGSYTSYPPSSDGTAATVGLVNRPDDDSFLRADDLQVAAPLVEVIPGGNEWATVGYFNVNVLDYREVRIAWGVPLATTLTGTPQATRIVLTYSKQGEPSTIPEGVTLVDSTDGTGTYIHDAEPGEWAYYTLFVKYESNAGDEYYEPAASLSVLTPNELDSTNSLYSKIPFYYRGLDSELDEGGGGPLYRYLSVIGWDVDRVRTLIDFLMSCKDPQKANGQTLDLIASDLGLDIMSQELGAARLRAVLNDIGALRRSTGLSTALTAAITALTGSVVTMSGSTIRVHPQRVNFIVDPMLTSTGANADGGVPSSSFNEIIDGGVPNTTVFDPPGPYGSPVDGGAPGTVFTETGVWSSVINPVEVNEYVARTLGAAVPVFPGDVFYFSIHNNSQETVTNVALDAIAGSVRSEIVQSDTPIRIGSTKYWKMEIPADFEVELPAVSSATISGTTGILTFSSPHNLNESLIQNGMQLTLSGFNPPGWNGTFSVVAVPSPTTVQLQFATPSILYEAPLWVDVTEAITLPGPGVAPFGTVTVNRALAAVRFHYSPKGDTSLTTAIGGNLLLEKNYIGSYFDGNTVRGGWVTGNPSISDFRWLGTENNSFSVYSENYQKTASVVSRLLPSLLPVTRLVTSGTVYSNRLVNVTTYTLSYNYIPGYS